MDDIWRKVIEATLGFGSYQVLREALIQESG
jgi:hypothetical protein